MFQNNIFSVFQLSTLMTKIMLSQQSIKLAQREIVEIRLINEMLFATAPCWTLHIWAVNLITDECWVARIKVLYRPHIYLYNYMHMKCFTWLKKAYTGYWEHYQQGKGQGCRSWTRRILRDMGIRHSGQPPQRILTAVVSHLHMVQSSCPIESKRSRCNWLKWEVEWNIGWRR